MNRLILLGTAVCAVVISLSATCRGEPSRVWTSVQGSTIEGTFVKVEEGTAFLRKSDDGKVLAVPISLLNPVDQLYVTHIAPRVWMGLSGKTVDGVFLESLDTEVRIKLPDGTIGRLALADLSPAYRLYAKTRTRSRWSLAAGKSVDGVLIGMAGTGAYVLEQDGSVVFIPSSGMSASELELARQATTVDQYFAAIRRAQGSMQKNQWAAAVQACRMAEAHVPDDILVKNLLKESQERSVPVKVKKAAVGQPHLQVRDLTPVKSLDAPSHPPLVLVKDGTLIARIYVVEPQVSPTLDRLVRELVTTIEMRTGAKLEVNWGEQPSPNECAIVIGDCKASRDAGIDAASLPIEGFEILTAKNHVYLVGSTKAAECGASNDATAWAVSDFMERFVGVRWYWSVTVGGRSVESSPDLVIEPTHYTDQPVFRLRQYWGGGSKPEHWTAITGEGGGELPRPTSHAIPEHVQEISYDITLAGLRAARSWPYTVLSHNPSQIWKNEAFTKRHPDMFSMKPDGSRNVSMLCYSSQKTFDFLIAGAEAVWDRGQSSLPQDPWCGHHVNWVQGDSLGISPYDSALNCHCPACRQSFRDGGASGHMCRFVKKVCDTVKRRWPDKKVAFLPYWNYAEPYPKVDFPGNLEILLADNQGGQMWRYPDGFEAGHEQRVAAWAARTSTGKVSLWTYSIAILSKTHAPIQFPHTLKAYYLRRSADSVGSFINGHTLGEWSNHAPTMYCWMKLLWNPELDVDAVMDEFCRRMFGVAAGNVRKMLEIGCRAFEGSGIHVAMGDGTENIGGLRRMFQRRDVRDLERLRKKSRELLFDDPVALQRLEYLTWTYDAFISAYEE